MADDSIDPDECEHPLEDRSVYGNPDPYGDRIGGSSWNGVPTRLSMDAECDRCGAYTAVHYQLDRESS